MRKRSLVVVTAFAFAAFACSSDEAPPALDTQPAERTEATTSAPPTTSATESTVATSTAVDDTIVAPTSEVPVSDVEAFSFAEHDLCEWITPERIAEIVAAEYDWEGTATEFDGNTGFPPPGGCGWVLSGDPVSDPFANVAIWDGSSSYPEFDVAVDYDDFDPDGIEFGEWVAGHPALSDGALFALGGWGAVRFGFPSQGQVIEMMLDVPGEEFREDYWTSMASVADRLMTELGWTS